MQRKTAIVFGASGLVGKALVEELCTSDRYDLVKIFVRSGTGFRNEGKIKEFILDFNNLKEYSGMISGDDLFICLGTTIKKAGSIRRMEEIDRDLPVVIASLASANSVERLAVVSSLGANPASSNNYLRIKGEMEKGLTGLKFKTIIIARPSLLLGKRSERRTLEEISKTAMRLLGFFLTGRLAKYKGIQGRDVARAMIKAINEKTGIQILESDILHKISTDWNRE
jgi:uncharacterized protein YbjT (DUF2867 family)